MKEDHVSCLFKDIYKD